MHHGMTVQAGLPQQLLGSPEGWRIIAAVQAARVERILMAVLAEKGRALQQQAVDDRTVGIMAIVAAVRHRFMLPQEGTALLGMAIGAGITHRFEGQQGVSSRTMGIMAIRAGQQAFIHRVMRAHAELRPLLLVTSGAHSGLCGRGQYRVTRSMQVVTVGTGQSGELVLAAHPVGSRILFMAAEAHVVLYLDRRHRPGRLATVELYAHRQPVGTPVFRAGPVAGLTVMVVEGCQTVSTAGMGRLQYGIGRGDIMAIETVEHACRRIGLFTYPGCRSFLGPTLQRDAENENAHQRTQGQPETWTE